ncbi:hypothetical protein [Labrenzia sp. R5_0]|uniref:hypothetical protein n=1 Tax=Labrenzia sp. R5_0 TaxID=2821108 RepID=UPI001AD9AB39|nr:hypothetical protein [Labrenzia sp. R5_0]MBO9458995.1 hypothetical protein [Labrenzia sp. R5_0]
MKQEVDTSRFRELYAGVERLSQEEKLRETLQAAENADVYRFAPEVCEKLFGHRHPEMLTGTQIDQFFEQFDPFVAWALESIQLKQ